MPDTTYHSGEHSGETMADVIEARSLVSRTLKVIAREGPFRGEDAIERLIVSAKDPGEHISKAEMTRVISSLNRGGKVHTRGSQRGDLTLIEATRRGYVDAGVPYPIGGEVGSRSHPSPAQHRTDGTDFRNHAPVAQGGEVTKVTPRSLDAIETRRRFNSDGSWTQHKVDDLAPEMAWDAVVALSFGEGVNITELGKRMNLSPSPASLRIRKAQALGWIWSVKDGPAGGYRLYLTPDAKDRLGELRRGAKQPKPRRQSNFHPTPAIIEVTEGSGKPLVVEKRVAYPNLKALVSRASELFQVARRLEELGHDEAALAVLATLDDLTPVEREIVAMIHELRIEVE